MGFKSATYKTNELAKLLGVDESKLKSAMKATSVGGFARVWEISEDKGNFAVCRLSTSKKRKDSDNWETDFQSNFVRFIGAAYNKVKNLNLPNEKGVSIQITSCESTVSYNAETKKVYTNYAVFDFDVPSDSGSSVGAKAAAKTVKKKAVDVEADDDPELPF